MNIKNQLVKSALVASCALTLMGSQAWAAGKRMHDQGNIKDINTKTSTFRLVDKENKTVTVAWNDKTSFLEHRKHMTAADLKAGEFVRVYGEEENGTLMAKSIHIRPSAKETTSSQHSEAPHNYGTW